MRINIKVISGKFEARFPAVGESEVGPEGSIPCRLGLDHGCHFLVNQRTVTLRCNRECSEQGREREEEHSENEAGHSSEELPLLYRRDCRNMKENTEESRKMAETVSKGVRIITIQYSVML